MSVTVALAFRASPRIGGGHAFRCLTLADGLALFGWSCRLVVDAETLVMVPALGRSDHVIAQSGRLDYPVDLLVVDDYHRHLENSLPGHNLARRVLVLDDLADRPHDCQFLMDATLGRKSSDYRSLVPAGCQVLAGPDYALLRPDFQRRRATALARRGRGKVERVLITMGVVDEPGLTLLALDAVRKALPEADVDIVLGSASRHVEAVRSRAAGSQGRVTLHVDTAAMPNLMVQADLAVGASGTTSWERCCLGLPTVIVVGAENQQLIAERLAALDAVDLVGRWGEISSGCIADRVRALAGDPSRLASMAERAAKTCDGRGVHRIILALAGSLPARDGRQVRLCLAEAGDAALIFNWQRHPATRRHAVNPAVPDEREHLTWMYSKLSDPSCLFCLIEHGGEKAGVLRLDLDPLRGHHVVSIFIDPHRYRMGLARIALALADMAAPGAHLAARVLDSNHASLSLFAAAGYFRWADGIFHRAPFL